MRKISDAIAALGESLDENVDRWAALSFDAFEHRYNGRLAGAYMRIANAQRRYTGGCIGGFDGDHGGA